VIDASASELEPRGAGFQKYLHLRPRAKGSGRRAAASVFRAITSRTLAGHLTLKTQPAHVDQGAPSGPSGLPMSIAADRHSTQHPPFARRLVATSNCSAKRVRVQRINPAPLPQQRKPLISRPAGRRQAQNFGRCDSSHSGTDLRIVVLRVLRELREVLIPSGIRRRSCSGPVRFGRPLLSPVLSNDVAPRSPASCSFSGSRCLCACRAHRTQVPADVEHARACASRLPR